MHYTATTLHKIKFAIQIVLLATLISLMLVGFLPLIDVLDELFALEFNQFMLIFGILLACIYFVLSLLAHYWHARANRLCNYFIHILPSSYLVSIYIWYFYLFVSKLVSFHKEDLAYYSTIMVAFSIFTLCIRLSKEVITLYNTYQTHQ